jgi:hypothetical protein
MAYQVSFDASEHIVIAQVWNAASREEFIAIGAVAGVLCQETSCKKYLINLRDAVVPAVSSTMSCYDFGESMAGTVLPVGIQIALVLPADAFSVEDVLFAVDVAMNRGRAIVTFTAEGEARDWLSKKQMARELIV